MQATAPSRVFPQPSMVRPTPTQLQQLGAPMPQSVYDFRRIHHYHILPGPPRLLAWDDPSRTGDHTAASRLIAPLGLCLSQLSRVLSLGPAHYALGGALGIAWGFGLRQSIHSLVLGRRALVRLHGQKAQLETAIKAQGRAPHTDALHRRMRTLQRTTRYGLVLDTIGGVGSALLGVAYLSRVPLLGGSLPGFANAALPLLHCAVVPPLLAPLAIACVERAGRAVNTRRRRARMRAYMDKVAHPDAARVFKLFAARQHELARYYALDALARGGAVTGASIVVFVGPAGLLLLVPCMAGLVVSTCFARRIVRVDDAMTPQEKMALDSDDKFISAIVWGEQDVDTLVRLRALRQQTYPGGWGTRFRPLMRIYRRLRYAPPPPAKSAADTAGRVLAAYERGETAIAKQALPDPHEVLEILDRARVRQAFARAMLKDKSLRRSLQGRGVSMAKRKWSIDTDRVALNLREAQWQGDPEDVASRSYSKAEEVLLTQGKTEAWRRLRALLDSYYRFAQARLKFIPAPARGQAAQPTLRSPRSLPAIPAR